MCKAHKLIFLLAFIIVSPTRAQTPTGAITGIVTDPTGAPVAGTRVSVMSRDTGLTRSLTTSIRGNYTVTALPPGVFQVTAEAIGFRPLKRTVIVEAGTNTPVDLAFTLDEINKIKETVTVEDVAPLIEHDQNQVGGVVSRSQIENLPLNGRNFLELAKLEPGVTNPVRGTNNRVFVPTLGSGVQTSPVIGYTRVTVDGANIDFVANIGSALNVSQDAVQEFQIATANFDLSTGLTSNGAINIVTRSGGNSFHGGGFYFYRDHNLAAYPGLQRDPSNPDPFFRRQQFGYHLGGPLRHNRAFFFTSYERNDQRGVFSIQPLTPEFRPLGGIFPSPATGNLFNVRFDLRLNQSHNAFLRYTHDGNRAFLPVVGALSLLPSAWSNARNWVDQTVAGLTSVLSPRFVNDLRFSYFFISSPEAPAGPEDCPGCVGVGAPRLNIPDAGVMLGQARRLSAVGRRYQLTESPMWQKGDHSLRFGFDWEHTTYSAQAIDQDPASMILYSPAQVRSFNANASPADQIPLPSSFLTLDQILQLPLKSFMTAVGPGLRLQRDFRKYRIMDLYRLYAGDTWHVSSRLTVNYGLAWSYEPHSLNTDLTKPQLLIPILGANNLGPPIAHKGDLSPALGFSWMITGDGKTVIRGGAGRYFDPVSFNSVNIGSERVALSPAGTGRRTVPGSAITWPGVNQEKPLEFLAGPTTFTAANLLDILPGIRARLTQQLNPDNRDFTFRNIDLDKTGSNLTDPSYESAYAWHFNLGLQRELARDLVISTDLVWRRFLHTFIPGIDYNRFNPKPQEPVISRCTEAQRNDLTAVCSNGAITFDSSTGIAQYKGLLVRLEKRFSHRTQFLASYALGSFKGTNGVGGTSAADSPAKGFNNDNWFENYGPLPTDLRHILNLSGVFDLPRQFQISFSTSAYSRPPFSAYVGDADFNGDGTHNDLLPGTRVNQFNRGLRKVDLVQLVQLYNEQFAGRQTIGGQPAPLLTLPANYTFNDGFFTQDFRLSRTFSLRTERLRLVVLGEVFNLFNTANLIGFSGNVANSASFGQPGARFSQVFGSGGPRAFQLGARISF